MGLYLRGGEKGWVAGIRHKMMAIIPPRLLEQSLRVFQQEKRLRPSLVILMERLLRC